MNEVEGDDAFVQSDLGCLQRGEAAMAHESDICSVSKRYAVSVSGRSIICSSTGRRPTVAPARLKCDNVDQSSLTKARLWDQIFSWTAANTVFTTTVHLDYCHLSPEQSTIPVVFSLNFTLYYDLWCNNKRLYHKKVSKANVSNICRYVHYITNTILFSITYLENYKHICLQIPFSFCVISQTSPWNLLKRTMCYSVS